MCNNKMFICSYKEEFSRYDLTLKNVLDVFIDNANDNSGEKSINPEEGIYFHQVS